MHICQTLLVREMPPKHIYAGADVRQGHDSYPASHVPYESMILRHVPRDQTSSERGACLMKHNLTVIKAVDIGMIGSSRPSFFRRLVLRLFAWQDQHRRMN